MKPIVLTRFVLTVFAIPLFALYLASTQAQTVTLSNGSSCGYSSLTVTPNGNVSVTCSGTLPPPAPPVDPTPVPPPPPTTPSGCNLGAVIQPALGFNDPPRQQRTVSGQVFAVPVVSSGSMAASVFTQGQQPQMASGTITTELSVSKCPGVMDRHPDPKCAFKGYGVNSNAITVFTAGTPFVRSQSDISGDGCWAPASEGPWYVNVKWTWPNCAYGVCGFSLQWAQGGYW